ncbi:unnamed protein product [Symbiodinium sp. KB8]|nr:unnamed protein product [Symbiodinium sp. KB8]
MSMPDVKIDWREEVLETINLVERFLLDATSSLRRIMEALRSYDEGNMTMDVKFASSTESRTIERALREPAHAVKGAAATVTFDRVALAFRAIELPLKDAVGRTESEVVPEAARRAHIDATLGPGRHLVRVAWLRLREAIAFLHDDLLAHVRLPSRARALLLAILEHRCGIPDVEEAQMYIPTQEELDDGEPMPEGEPEDYNQEDWADDIADVAEDIEELTEKLPRDHVEVELAEFELPPGDGSE